MKRNNQHSRGEDNKQEVQQVSATSLDRKLRTMSSYLLLLILVCLPLTQGAPLCRYSKHRQVMSCSSLHLSSIPDNTFSSHTTNLIFNNNNLKAIESGTLQDYPALVNLHVYSNKIENIDEDAFSQLPNLQKIDLSNNKLDILEEKTISSNLVLESLSLNNNPMEEMPLLESLSLQKYYLRSCSLIEIPVDSFSLLPSLQTIDLRDNLLSSIPVDLFSNLLNLKSVYLQGNPLRCGPDFQRMLEKYKEVIVDQDKLSCFDSEAKEMTVSTDDLPKKSSTTSKPPSTSKSSEENSEDEDDAPVAAKSPINNDRSPVANRPFDPQTYDQLDYTEIHDDFIDYSNDDDSDLLVGNLLIYLNVALIAIIAGLCVGLTIAFLLKRHRNCCSSFSRDVQYESTPGENSYEVVRPLK